MNKPFLNPLILLILRASSDFEKDGIFSLKCQTHDIYFDSINKLFCVFDGSNCLCEKSVSYKQLLKEIIRIRIFEINDFLQQTLLNVIVHKNICLNKFYLDFFCTYLPNSSSDGNKTYWLPDDDFNILIITSLDYQSYLICYTDIFTHDCFFEEYLTNKDLLYFYF